MNDQAAWTLHGNIAALNCGQLSARVDASRPSAGVHDVAIDGLRQAANLLRVYRADLAGETSWPLPLAESYIRGRDLVATYRAADDWPFSPQLYWRANSLRAVDGVLASASMLLSVQTHLLDTVPQIAVMSNLPCDESLFVCAHNGAQPSTARIDSSLPNISPNEDGCLLSRFRDVPLSYVEIMPSGDFRAVRLRTEEKNTAVEWRLFAEFLEKGVIRRARVHAAIVTRDGDIATAAACCKAIDGLELPLTT